MAVTTTCKLHSTQPHQLKTEKLRPLLDLLHPDLWLGKPKVVSQNKEGILPVATLSIALYVFSKSRSRWVVARGVISCRRHYKPQ